MRHALLHANGLGTPLWKWRRAVLPKQLLPHASSQTLLKIAHDRFKNVVPANYRFDCVQDNRAIRRRSLRLAGSQEIVSKINSISWFCPFVTSLLNKIT
jgi:mannose-1-phosphate guanylyltransferase